MNMIGAALDKLTDNYQKAKSSLIGKLFQLVFSQMEDVNSAFQKIEDWQDVDMAQGVALDDLGKRVVEGRGQKEDDVYRKFIELAIFLNHSAGEIETINTVLRTYMGKDFISVAEGWNSRYKEPASMVIEMTPGLNEVPNNLIHRTKGGGVSVKFVRIISFNQHFAIVGLSGETTTIYPWTPSEINLRVQTPIGTAFQSVETFTVYPK